MQGKIKKRRPSTLPTQQEYTIRAKHQVTLYSERKKKRTAEAHIPSVYKGNNLSASGSISWPEDDTVAQNLRYECRMLIQRFVTCSLTCESGLEGISLAPA